MRLNQIIPKSHLINYFDSIHYIKKQFNESMCEKEEKWNESVNNEFKIMGKRDSLRQLTVFMFVRYFLIHYFDIASLLKSDKILYIFI